MKFARLIEKGEQAGEKQQAVKCDLTHPQPSVEQTVLRISIVNLVSVIVVM